MAEFVCKVADGRGQVSVQVENARSEAELRRRLSEKGLFVYSVRSRALPALVWRWPGRRRRPSANDFLLFNQQFVTLIRAGMPILQSLDLLAQRATRPGLGAVLHDIRRRVREGSSLTEAFQAQDIFSEVYTASLLAGERSGNLAGVLEQFIAYQKITATVRRRLLTAIVYPTILVVFAIGVLTYVNLYVIPRFAELFSEMNVELPWLTVAVISIALDLRAYAFVFALIAVGSVIAVVLAWRTEAGAHALDRLRLRVPLLGSILLKFRLAQFCRTLSTLLLGGIPLVPSLEVSAAAAGSPVLRHATTTATQRVREGQSLHKALASTGVLPSLATEMVEVGEGTGALPQMLNSVAEFYEEELNVLLTRLLAVIEPLLLIMVGGIILVILIALYLPIFSLGTIAR